MNDWKPNGVKLMGSGLASTRKVGSGLLLCGFFPEKVHRLPRKEASRPPNDFHFLSEASPNYGEHFVDRRPPSSRCLFGTSLERGVFLARRRTCRAKVSLPRTRFSRTSVHGS